MITMHKGTDAPFAYLHVLDASGAHTGRRYAVRPVATLGSKDTVRAGIDSAILRAVDSLWSRTAAPHVARNGAADGTRGAIDVIRRDGSHELRALYVVAPLDWSPGRDQ